MSQFGIYWDQCKPSNGVFIFYKPATFYHLLYAVTQFQAVTNIYKCARKYSLKYQIHSSTFRTVYRCTFITGVAVIVI